jgi:hypothetical protein
MHDRSRAPSPEREPAWRAACVAYREKRQAGCRDLEAHHAALAALQAVWPMPDREAHLEVARAIYYASVEHRAWFWRGVGTRGT